MLRGAFHFEVAPNGDLENTALNVEILRSLFLHPALIDGDDLGPGNRGDFDHGAWHVACHIAGAGGVCRHANGSLMWLEISHRRTTDEYCATVTLRHGKATETLCVDTAEGREVLAGSSLVGFVEGTSLGRTSARGVLDPPDRFNLWRRQDFDQPVGSASDGGKVWEHWCTLRDIRPSHSIGTSMLAAFVSLAAALGDRFIPTVARGRREYGHPRQVAAFVYAGLTAESSALWDTKPTAIPTAAVPVLQESDPRRSSRGHRAISVDRTAASIFHVRAEDCGLEHCWTGSNRPERLHAMKRRRRPLIVRRPEDILEIGPPGSHVDSWKAAWRAIRAGGEVIAEVQRLAGRRGWESLKEARPALNPSAQKLLEMRLEAIHKFKVAPHHRYGFRLSAETGTRYSRPVNSLCLISGHEGQEIPGLVDADRVVVDAEHMQQALGPATLTEIFKIRKAVGEHVYISTNVSETPQVVRAVETGKIDARSTAALTASKIIAALRSGADVVKIGFANLDPYKEDLRSADVALQMKLVRRMVDDVVRERLLVFPLSKADGRYPLISVFFPEVGINSIGERPMDIARVGIDLTAGANWQGMLIDTFEKYSGRRYNDFFSVDDTRELARRAHAKGIEFWIAGSIRRQEVGAYVKAGVDLICFGGAARYESGSRVTKGGGGTRDEEIKLPLVRQLVREFDRADPKRRARKRRR